MARPLRIEQIGCWYHVTARGKAGRDIFRDDRDRRRFLELLAEAVGMFALRLHAYVLMPDHYHLLVELREANLSRAVHWLNVSYTVWFNQRHGRGGHLLHGRFRSVAVEPRVWGLEVSRHIHLNPGRPARVRSGNRRRKRIPAKGTVKPDRKGARERIHRLRRHVWSSYGAYVGSARKPSWLTTESVLALGGVATRTGARYREYCEEAVRRGTTASPWDQVVGQTMLGSERFVARLIAASRKGATSQRKRSGRPGFEEVVKVVETLRGEKWRKFRDRYGDDGRDLALYLGRRACGMSIGELSERAGIRYMTGAVALGRFARRLREDRRLARLLQSATARLRKEQASP